MTVTAVPIARAKASGLDLPTWVMEALATAPQDFTGRVEVNCFRGGVTNVLFTWSVKPSN